MHSHTVRHGTSLNTLRAVLHVPKPALPFTRPAQAACAPAPGWLERLARWAERQPVHHRMGSYLLRR